MEDKTTDYKVEEVLLEEDLEESGTELPSGSPVAPVEATVKATLAIEYTARDGDTYASISALLCPPGKTKHEYAKELYAKNGGKVLRSGVVVNI